MINKEEQYSVNTSRFIASELGEEMILMDLETGDYVALNEVSAVIWKRLEKGAGFDEVVDYLLEQYEIDEVTCRKDTEESVNEMVEKGLLLKR